MSDFVRHAEQIEGNLREGSAGFAAAGNLTHARVMSDALLLITALKAMIPVPPPPPPEPVPIESADTKPPRRHRRKT